MTDSALHSQIEAANAYEALFVPALFGQWTQKVADAARIQSGQRVLDVACGTGVLTREVASRVGVTGYVAGLDPNPGMLEVAKQHTPEVTWSEGFAESLPFTDQAFDAVVSQFGLMFFIDRHQAIREMLRVLAPGGRLTVAVWDALDNIPAYAAEIALLERVAGRAAADAVRAPFVLGDRRELKALFNAAGVGSVEITTHRGTARFPNLRLLVEADVRGWLPIMGVVLPEEQIDRIVEEVDQALAPFVSAQAPAMFDLSAHIVTGVKV